MGCELFDFVEHKIEGVEITEEFIHSFEKENSIKFPELLREYYLNYNIIKFRGNCEDGEWIEFYLTMGKKNIDFCVDFILPIIGANVCVKEKLELNKSLDWWPYDTYIPFAADVEPTGYYYWDSADEKIYYVSSTNYKNPIHICNSIKEFFDILNTAIHYTEEKPYKLPAPGYSKNNSKVASVLKSILGKSE